MEFNSSKGFNDIQSEITLFLYGFGFKLSKSKILYRITEDSILQFISFQKGDRSLSQQMTINIVLQGLFSPTCSFELLQPGARMGRFLTTQTDKWWFCDTEHATSQSIAEIKKSFSDYLLPFFDKTLFSIDVCAIIDKAEFNFIWDNHYTFIDKGFFYLKAKKYEKAINIFESTQPSKVPKFKTIKNLINEQKFEDVIDLLNQNIMHSKAKLNILI